MKPQRLRQLLSHVDIRVRDRLRATAFYDAVLGALGYSKTQGEQWTTYDPCELGEVSAIHMWFGFTVDPTMTPGLTRVAFAAETCEDVDRATTIAMQSGAQNIEGPDYAYGPEYYAVFFEDPDGNRLEVCCCGPQARAAS